MGVADIVAAAQRAIARKRAVQDKVSAMNEEQLGYFAGGEWRASKTTKWMDCYDPSTGEVIAAGAAVHGRRGRGGDRLRGDAFPAWADTPASKRVQVLFRMKALLDQHLEELTYLVAKEHGKVWDEAMGDVLKVTEVVEFACGIPHLMKGPALMNCTSGYDTTQYMEPLGVFAGIAPWNFPAMIPMGWMAPLCIATGNTMVLKAASFTPQTSMRICDLWAEAGLPTGVLNLVTCSRNEAEILLRHPDVKGISFVGSTAVGRHIYATAAANGKRVQALTEAKNHALVLQDAALERTRARHHQLGVRLRGRALHGAAGGRGRRSDRRRAGGAAARLHERAEDRPGVRQDQPARPAGERRAPRSRS